MFASSSFWNDHAVYKRKHLPGAVRPALPARCNALAWDWERKWLTSCMGKQGGEAGFGKRAIPYLARRRDHQRFHPRPRVVAFLFTETGVDDVLDAVDCEGGFRDVRGEDDLSSSGGGGSNILACRSDGNDA